jgi:solute carrier family 13 (sodium-dependent dicarboxylate transporter), member 2/3/5
MENKLPSQTIEPKDAGQKRSWRRWAWIFLALLVFFLILVLPLPQVALISQNPVALSEAGRGCLATVVLCLILWVSEAIPIAITSLAVFLLMPALGVADLTKTIQSGLGNPLILFFISLFLISAAFEKVGLGRRVSDRILALSNGNNSLLNILMLVVGAILSMFAGNLAATTVMLGTAQQVLKTTDHPTHRTNFGRRLMLTTSWGPMIGSVGTPLGAGSNILTMIFLETLAGQKMTFLGWMTLGIPLAFLVLPFAWLTLIKTFPDDKQSTLLPRPVVKSAPLSRNEKVFLVIFCSTLFLWIFGPSLNQLTGGRLSVLSLSFVGMMCAICLFLPGVDLLTWSEAEHAIHINILLSVAGGLTAGVLLSESGAAQWLAALFLQMTPASSPIGIIFLLLVVILILRLLFNTTTAAATVIIPLVIAVAQNIGMNPWLLTMAASFAINLTFLLPMQAAIHMMGYSTGYYSSKDMVRSGLWLSLAAIILIGLMTTLLIMNKKLF